MKNNKKQKLAAKITGQMMVENLGYQIGNFLASAKDAGITKKIAGKFAKDLLTAAVDKVNENPKKYMHGHHGGH